MKYTDGFKKMLQKFLKDESAQATTEYVVFLVLIVGAIFMVGRQVSDFVQNFFLNRLADNFKRNFFKPENMYRFPLR